MRASVGPFRGRDREGLGPLLPLVLAGLFSLGAVLRWLDLLRLLPRPRLLFAYLRLWATAFVHSPWSDGSFDKRRDARRFHKSMLELTYGETPVVTAVRALRAAGVDASSRVLDLGCGRGRVLLAARLLGARAEGLDMLESHVDAAREPLAAIGADVRVGLAEESRLEGVTHVYVAWTCFSTETRARVVAHLRTAPPGLRVVVLNHRVDDDAFALVASLTLLCSWGRVPAYVYERGGAATGRAADEGAA